jgi:hypothetical protein
MGTGFLATSLLPETKGKTLEELSGEDDYEYEEEEVDIEFRKSKF